VQISHEIHGKDVFGSWCLHAIQVEADLWYCTDAKTAVILRQTRQGMVQWLADRIMRDRPRTPEETTTANYVVTVQSTATPRWFGVIDLAGNSWFDEEYMAPVAYLPLLVPAEMRGLSDAE